MGIELIKDPPADNARCKCYIYGKEMICHKEGIVGILSDEQERALCPKGRTDIVKLPKGVEENFRFMTDNLHIASAEYRKLEEKGLDVWRKMVKEAMKNHRNEKEAVPEYNPPERKPRNFREAQAKRMKSYVKSPEGMADPLTRKKSVRPGPTPEEEAEASKRSLPSAKNVTSRSGAKRAKEMAKKCRKKAKETVSSKAKGDPGQSKKNAPASKEKVSAPKGEGKKQKLQKELTYTEQDLAKCNEELKKASNIADKDERSRQVKKISKKCNKIYNALHRQKANRAIASDKQ